jgi:hypothetical protein
MFHNSIDDKKYGQCYEIKNLENFREVIADLSPLVDAGLYASQFDWRTNRLETILYQ